MKEKLFVNYPKKNINIKNLSSAKSHSSSKHTRKNIISSELKLNNKKIVKNIHQRNILFNNKLSIKNPNSTSTSSLSNSTEKKYLTPTKYNQDLNIGNDYYFNESFNNRKDLFQNMNISRPKLDYNNKYKKNKNLHLALGTGIDRYNNIYFSGNDYWNNKELLINRSFKFHKNKLVLCRKINISHNNSGNNEDKKESNSKSVENCKINKKLTASIDYSEGKRISINDNYKANNRYSFFPEKSEEKEKEKEKPYDINSSTKRKKYKNIVLRPHKIQKENQLSNIINFKETAIKRNIKVNLYKKEENPELIKKIMQKFNIKPKYSRVFK